MYDVLSPSHHYQHQHCSNLHLHLSQLGQTRSSSSQLLWAHQNVLPNYSSVIPSGLHQQIILHLHLFLRLHLGIILHFNLSEIWFLQLHVLFAFCANYLRDRKTLAPTLTPVVCELITLALLIRISSKLFFVDIAI